MKRIGIWTVLIAMCLFLVSTTRLVRAGEERNARRADLTGFIPVFVDDKGKEAASNIFQAPDGQIVISGPSQCCPSADPILEVSTSLATGIAIVGRCSVLSDCTGVMGRAKNITGATGVFGFVDQDLSSPGGGGAGVRGFALVNGGIGVQGEGAIGVEGFSLSGTAGRFDSVTGDILSGGNGNPASARFRVDAGGNVFATTYNTGGADFAESMQPAGRKNDYEPGDVLVIDQTAARRVALAQRPYSTLVAGIYSTKPGVLASPYRMGDPRLAKEVPLAIVGIVPCKVSDENGPVKAGDLLVTSSTPGHAMKGTDHSRMLGAIVGKALEPLSSSKGVIEVLITLQ